MIDVSDIGKVGLYVVEDDSTVYLFDNHSDAVDCNVEECNGRGEFYFHSFQKRPSFSEAQMTAEYFYPDSNINNRV